MTYQPHCANSNCGNLAGEDSVYDQFYKKRVCRPCFNKAFATAKTHGYGEWFEANYNQSDYDRKFWDSVGAFVKLPDSGDGYK